MSGLESMPIVPVSQLGDRYLGADARPELLSNLVVDEEYNKAMSAMLSRSGAGAVVTIPIKTEDLNDSILGTNTRAVAPATYSEDRSAYTVPDITSAAVDHRVFGMGMVSTFRSDKPQQGINFLREAVPVPADSSIPFNQPTVGPWNPINMNEGILGGDPRYTAPDFSVGALKL
jgi:hypothetical protein